MIFGSSAFFYSHSAARKSDSCRVIASHPTFNRLPYGALDRQRPLFKERGLDLNAYFNRTLNIEYEGWVYYPHPETKLRHFQNPSLLEVVAVHIPPIKYGDKLDVLVNSEEILIK